jgi:hypothetical protein
VIQNLVKFTHTGTTATTKVADIIIPPNVIKDNEIWEFDIMFSRNSTLFSNNAVVAVSSSAFNEADAVGFIRNCQIGNSSETSALISRRLLFRDGKVNRTTNSGGFYTDNASGLKRGENEVDLTAEIVINFYITLSNASDEANFEFAILRKIS